MKLKVLALHLMLIGFCIGASISAQEFTYRYQPSPIDNPIRGLAPYAAMMPWLNPDATESEKQKYLADYRRNVFPHSIEFHYFSMRELMPSKGTVDFAPIEKWLHQANSRKCQLTFRIFLEYPDRSVSVPQYLVDDGLKITTWKNKDGQTIHAPDYGDENLRQEIDVLISELGNRYDGDRRVACLTMGILGHWGEWHSYPRGDLFPDKEYQRHVMQQFESAFKKTPVLMRYPAGPNDGSYAANHDSPFGFHDDSFAWATRETGKTNDDWFFLSKMKSAGAADAWKSRMIGGAIRPEVWGCVFDKDSCAPQGQGFDDCVADSHVTWLMDSGMFASESPASKRRIENGTRSVGKMGYEFFVPKCSIKSDDQTTSVTVSLTNRGVAPFYFDWPVEIAILGDDGRIIQSRTEDWSLSKILPGDEPVRRSVQLSTALQENQKIGMRIPNPMTDGFPIRFANENQEKDGSWLILK